MTWTNACFFANISAPSPTTRLIANPYWTWLPKQIWYLVLFSPKALCLTYGSLTSSSQENNPQRTMRGVQLIIIFLWMCDKYSSDVVRSQEFKNIFGTLRVAYDTDSLDLSFLREIVRVDHPHWKLLLRQISVFSRQLVEHEQYLKNNRSSVTFLIRSHCLKVEKYTLASNKTASRSETTNQEEEEKGEEAEI